LCQVFIGKNLNFFFLQNIKPIFIGF